MGFGRHIRKNNSVHNKLTVIRIVAKITSVSKVAFAVFGVIVHRLVNPIPNCTTANKITRLNSFPIIYQISNSISHRMSVFRNMERIFNVVRAFRSSLHPSNRWILIRTHIYNIVISLILNRSRSIKFFQSVVSRYEIFAWSCFISKRPNDNRRAIYRCVSHFQHPSNVRFFPFFGVRKRLFSVVILMRFNVRFIFQINAIFVAQVVPIWVVRVMRISHVIDVGFHHQFYFVFHLFVCNGVTHRRIGFVPIYSLEFHRFSVYVEISSRFAKFVIFGFGVFNFYFSKTCVGRNGFYYIVFLVFKLCN